MPKILCGCPCVALDVAVMEKTALGSRHRLTKPGKIPVEMIEVQSGSYLGEDDIVRFQDRYGRSDAPRSDQPQRSPQAALG